LTQEERLRQQEQEEAQAQRAYEEENQRRKEAGYRQTDNAVIIKFWVSVVRRLSVIVLIKPIKWNFPSRRCNHNLHYFLVLFKFSAP
jgi:hypothetical protein